MRSTGDEHKLSYREKKIEKKVNRNGYSFVIWGSFGSDVDARKLSKIFCRTNVGTIAIIVKVLSEP